MSGRLKTLRVAILVSLGVAAMLIAPAAASGGPVEDVVKRVGDTVNNVVKGVNDALGGAGGGGAGGGGLPGGQAVPTPAPAPAPASGLPPNYVPPAHGTNPHGMGTGAYIDITPDQTNPLPDEEGGPEEVIVGRSRGEQLDSGAYHGHITILAALGSEIIGVDTVEGESDNGPLAPLNDALAQVCTQSGGLLCLEVLGVDSTTTASGSSNSFRAANVGVGVPGGGGAPLIGASALESNGNISDDGNCQTSSGSSIVSNANVATIVSADVVGASSESTACNDGTETQESDSSAVNVNLLPPLPSQACEDGVPNTIGLELLGILTIECNADDSQGAQLGLPNGVREGLTVFVLPLVGAPIIATTAAAESHAVAPGEGPEPPGPPGPDGRPPRDGGPGPGPDGPDDECPDPDNPDCPGGPGGPGGPGEGPTGKGPGDLPFTGADVATLGMIGLAIVGTGLGLMALADRRRRLRGVTG